MKAERIEEINRELDFARHNLNCLIALFGYKRNSMVWLNRSRAISCIDCIIDIMNGLKEAILNDDGSGK